MREQNKGTRDSIRVNPQVENVPSTCGSWKLEREIGRGAYGAVYLAIGINGEIAAVKVCRRDILDRANYEREWRGAKLYQQIPASEGLVRLLEIGSCDWGFYAVMELADDEFGERIGEMDGYHPKTLARVIAGEKALSVENALKLGIALAKGLVNLQRHHLLHRDVKPGNVIFVRGRPVLSDPGLLVEEAEAASLVGTPGYVPPESFIGSGSDVYSLGLTLKVASFGRPVEELGNGPMLEADTGNLLFPAWWRILNKATHPDTSCRYRSAKSLLKDLLRLRRQMVLVRFTKGWMLLVPIAVSLLAIVFWVITMVRAPEARKAAAERVLAEFTEMRVREELASLGVSRRAAKRNVEAINRSVTNVIQKLSR